VSRGRAGRRQRVAVIEPAGGAPRRRSMPLPIVWDEGPNAKVSSASIAAWLKEGSLRRPGAGRPNKRRTDKTALAGASRNTRRSTPIRTRTRQVEERRTRPARYTATSASVVLDAERTSRARRPLSEGLRSADPAMREFYRPSSAAGSPPLHVARFIVRPGGPHRQRCRGTPVKAGVVARGGHEATAGTIP